MVNAQLEEGFVRCKSYRDVEIPKLLTSGGLTVYYVNTENQVEDGGAWAKLKFQYSDDLDPRAVFRHVHAQYDKSTTFKLVVDNLVREVSPDLDESKGLISGGARRDWLFSMPVARILGLEHVAWDKKGIGYLFNEEGELISVNPQLQNRTVYHVADLMTKGSSAYDPRDNPPTGWIPNIWNAGGNVHNLYSVVDRCQGGPEILKDAVRGETANPITAKSLILVNADFLRRHSTDPNRAVAYFENPNGWSEGYLRQNGVEAIVNDGSFSPDKVRDRLDGFLATYATVLDENNKALRKDLQAQVQAKHGYDIMTGVPQ